MTFEATFTIPDAKQALATMQDATASADAAKAGITAILESGALPTDRLLHVHATTSERMVAILVRVVESPADAR